MALDTVGAMRSYQTIGTPTWPVLRSQGLVHCTSDSVVTGMALDSEGPFSNGRNCSLRETDSALVLMVEDFSDRYLPSLPY